MKRRRDDSVKGGQGIDNGLGERFGKTDVVSPWADHHGDDQVGEIDPASQMPAADENRDIQFMWATRDIFDDVNANSDVRGDSVNANSGPIKYGINRKQDDK
jgi:hypothetical protein